MGLYITTAVNHNLKYKELLMSRDFPIILDAICIVMALFGLYSVFFGLPKGKRKGPAYDVASTYLKLIRNGGFGTLAYWAIPILLLVFVGVLSGALWLVLAFVGLGASKKYFGEPPATPAIDANGV